MGRKNKRQERERLPHTKHRPNRAASSPDSTQKSELLCKECILDDYCPVHDGSRDWWEET